MEYGLRLIPEESKEAILNVLILVLMEYGLRQRHTSWRSEAIRQVLILVLMEYGLRQHLS